MRKTFPSLCLAAALTSGLSVGLAGCGEPEPNTRGVYMLMDTSGTYSGELEKAQQIINVVLTRLDTGDSFAVARIDTGSFSEKDIIAKATFDERPSLANREKRQFRELVEVFVDGIRPATHTDITGGVLQATEYLEEKGTGRKVIIIFSDLAEEQHRPARLHAAPRRLESPRGGERRPLDRHQRPRPARPGVLGVGDFSAATGPAPWETRGRRARLCVALRR
jgi:hypothetical protein